MNPEWIYYQLTHSLNSACEFVLRYYGPMTATEVWHKLRGWGVVVKYNSVFQSLKRNTRISKQGKVYGQG